MAYDYDALVTEFTQKRLAAAAEDDKDDDAQQQQQQQQQECLQAAVQALETLSSHCPMTPLLWIQYAAALRDWLQSMGADTATVRQSQAQLLALGLVEFPGSVLLQCRHVQACCLDHDDKDDDTKAKNNDTAEKAILQAIDCVGKGSYRKADDMVAWLYRKLADLYRRVDDDNNNNLQRALQVFVQQARVPLTDANDSLSHFIQTWAAGQDVPEDILDAVEQGRRLVAKVYSAADGQDEDEIEAQLHQGGLLPGDDLVWKENGDIDWEKMEQPRNNGGQQQQRYSMGYGGGELARAFVQYASSYLKETENNVAEDYEDIVRKSMEDYKRTQLVWDIYERGVAECPTVESLWLSYLKELSKKGTNEQRLGLVDLVKRACRNCPYSLALVQQDFEITQQLVKDGLIELEPEDLLGRVQAALNRKFLPGGQTTWCDLHLQVISVTRQRLLSLLLPTYDKDHKKIPPANPLSDDATEEAEDLVEDLRELYETIGNLLHEKFPDFVAGRVKIMQDRALTEYHLIQPLQQIASNSSASVPSTASDSVGGEALSKAARLHGHPDTHLKWIRFQQYNKPPTKDRVAVVQSLVSVSRSFQIAWQQASPKAIGGRDFAMALAELAHEWVQWESLFGSFESLERVRESIQRKYRKIEEDQLKKDKKQGRDNRKEPKRKRPFPQTTTEVEVQQSQSRKKSKVAVENSNSPAPSTNEEKAPLKVGAEDVSTKDVEMKDSAIADTTKSTGKEKGPSSRPKVTINGLEYPAHPLTIRVSNLAEEVEDMDLVDLLKSKCGAIVHARIVRDKGHGKTKSKGWGLVQFEERGAVEKALELSEELGLYERLVKIERSNVPAVYLVPPGMHRVKAKGEGRSSKRNEKKKTETVKPHSNATSIGEKVKDVPVETQNDTGAIPASKPSTTAPRPSILSLAPRGVLKKKAARPKAKISVVPASSSGAADSNQEDFKK